MQSVHTLITTLAVRREESRASYAPCGLRCSGFRCMFQVL